MNEKSESVPLPSSVTPTAQVDSSAPVVSVVPVLVSSGLVVPPPFSCNLPVPQAQPESADVPAGESSNNSVLIPIQYELYSNFKNRPTAQDTITLPSTLPPMEFRSCIASAMGLEPSEAKLGYTIFGVAKAQPKCVFNTKLQVEEAIKKVQGVIQRARSVKKGLSIDPALKDDNNESTPLSSKVALPKAKVPGKLSKHESVGLQKAMRLRSIIVKLRSHLRCQLCRGQFCYVEPRGGRHIRCSHEMLTLWAKQHIETPDIVTLRRPPNIRLFDPPRGLSLSKIQAEASTSNSGCSADSTICVAGDTPPPVKCDPYMDVIDISSDSGSDSSFYLIDTDSLPDPINIISNQPIATPSGPSVAGRPVTPHFSAGHLTNPNLSFAQFLYNLHTAFPTLGFLEFHPQLEALDLYGVRDLATRSVDWIIESVGMSTAQALIVLGVAMSIIRPDRVGEADIKGKGKVKDEFEY